MRLCACTVRPFLRMIGGSLHDDKEEDMDRGERNIENEKERQREYRRAESKTKLKGSSRGTVHER